MKRLTLAVALAALGALGALIWLVVSRGGIRGGFADTAPLAAWLVALGTGGLAIATFLLARGARDEARAVRDEAEQVKRQVEIEAERLVAAQRPLVLPRGEDKTLVGGLPYLGITNAGAGPALNIRGALYWTGTPSGAQALHPQVLAVGQSTEALVLGEGAVVNWTNAVGYLRYHDLSGVEWQTHFRFHADGYGNISVQVLAAGPTTEFGEPGYNAEGWVNRPEHISLWQVTV